MAVERVGEPGGVRSPQPDGRAVVVGRRPDAGRGASVPPEPDRSGGGRRQAGGPWARDAGRIGGAAGMLMLGGFALAACLVLGVGAELEGGYWAGALIVGGLLVLVGGLTAGRGWRALNRRLGTEEAVEVRRERRAGRDDRMVPV